LQVDIPEDRAIRRIAEGDMIEANIAPQRADFDGVRPIGNIGLDRQQLGIAPTFSSMR